MRKKHKRDETVNNVPEGVEEIQMTRCDLFPSE